MRDLQPSADLGNLSGASIDHNRYHQQQPERIEHNQWYLPLRQVRTTILAGIKLVDAFGLSSYLGSAAQHEARPRRPRTVAISR